MWPWIIFAAASGLLVVVGLIGALLLSRRAAPDDGLPAGRPAKGRGGDLAG